MTRPCPFLYIEEAEWPSVASTLPLQPLFRNERTATPLVYGKVIGDQV